MLNLRKHYLNLEIILKCDFRQFLSMSVLLLRSNKKLRPKFFISPAYVSTSNITLTSLENRNKIKFID